MRHAGRMLLVAGLALGSAGCGAADEGEARQETAQLRAEPVQRIEAYERALLRGDPAEVKGFWTEDARVLLPGLDLEEEAVAAFIDDFYAGGGEVTSVEFHPADLFVHGDAAYELGWYEETGRFGGEPPETFRGNYFLRWERGEDGSWRIDRFVAGPVDAPPGG